MTTRIQKNEVAKRVASRLSIDEKVSEEYLDAVLETLYEAFKSGESVTLKNFGNFYLDPRRSGCVFKFNPSQKLKALFGWSSTYKGPLQHAKALFTYQASGADGLKIAVLREGRARLAFIQAAAHRRRLGFKYGKHSVNTVKENTHHIEYEGVWWLPGSKEQIYGNISFLDSLNSHGYNSR